MNIIFRLLMLSVIVSACETSKEFSAGSFYNDPHRPQVHFTPKANWMNDPNGMVFFNKNYHLFYQYYPDSTVWGPMHWGHATSTDLVRWEHKPIALFPDSLGYIFSGSAIVDFNNSSGFGVNGKIPLVAIFTHHDPVGERNGSINYQNQSLAYSLDEGTTWIKYSGNPVLKNPGIKDFRDPKVSWHQPSSKWIMTLATLDRITFYSSANLKEWTKESEFGKDIGAHGGVWECPDLFELKSGGENIWVLLVSINPGGPNGGSATQYFTGQFDGKTFTPYQTDTRWIDYGPDNYAGVTWSNTGVRKIFLGWMSNWQYANLVPTLAWRSATTVPRDLQIIRSGDRYLLASAPVPELAKLAGPVQTFNRFPDSVFKLTAQTAALSGASKLQIISDQIDDFSILLSNKAGNKLVIGYDKAANHYYIDRSASGETGFEAGFAAKHHSPRLTDNPNVELTLIIDNSSVELFADGGLSVMSSVFFPTEILSELSIHSAGNFKLKSVQFNRYRSMYKKKIYRK